MFILLSHSFFGVLLCFFDDRLMSVLCKSKCWCRW